tara:strand:+ start:491 stop:1285 length:795 start_codon:yes stop_codon:yes gene_type:complete
MKIVSEISMDSIPPLNGKQRHIEKNNTLAKGFSNTMKETISYSSTEENINKTSDKFVKSGLMERVLDDAGNHIKDQFRIRYSDGSFSKVGDVNSIEKLRRKILAEQRPIETFNDAENLNPKQSKMFSNDEVVSMTDIVNVPEEQFGSDMVSLEFLDGTRRITQKALFETAKDLGVIKSLKSETDFADWHLNEWAGGVTQRKSYMDAHTQFNSSQKHYDDILAQANPAIYNAKFEFLSKNIQNKAVAKSVIEAHLADQSNDLRGK